VITDAVTAFVLKIIIYTGKTTYNTPGNEEEKKTVQIVKALCNAYNGSHRTIYVDRFYTSLDLLRALYKMDIYVTGTVMANRLPKDLKIAKSSATFKEMDRGDFKKHVYKFKDSEGIGREFGLVAWKDSEIVYCLTSVDNTNAIGECRRRSSDGIIELPRPQVIDQYNKFMGGVDLADMRRLHCNSTIMGQHRWWLKLFFYLLDVGTANALVLYREAMKNDPKSNNISIAEFKRMLVHQFVGDEIAKPIKSDEKIHHLISQNKRYTCVYCNTRRTRFVCAFPSCGLPLCGMASNNGEEARQCFLKAHANDAVHEACINQKHAMINRSNKRGKN
jgi:hypothetical protein